MTTKGHKNLKMNNGVYKLRREVMSYIYEAKTLLKGRMDRVTIRITDCDRAEVLGVARMAGKAIWIPADKVSHKNLRATVLHELLHALYAQPHVAGCALMGPVACETTRAEENALFLKYAKGV